MSAGTIQFAHFLDANSIWAWFAVLTVPFGFVALAGKLSMRPAPLPNRLMAIGGIGFAGSILTIFAIENFISRAEWAEIRPQLFSPIVAAEIDGTPNIAFAPLVDALRAQHELPAQHTSPMTKHHLVLQTRSGILILDVARDSIDPREFWIWNSSFQTTVEMGRVRANSSILFPG